MKKKLKSNIFSKHHLNVKTNIDKEYIPYSCIQRLDKKYKDISYDKYGEL